MYYCANPVCLYMKQPSQEIVCARCHAPLILAPFCKHCSIYFVPNTLGQDSCLKCLQENTLALIDIDFTSIMSPKCTRCSMTHPLNTSCPAPSSTAQGIEHTSGPIQPVQVGQERATRKRKRIDLTKSVRKNFHHQDTPQVCSMCKEVNCICVNTEHKLDIDIDPFFSLDFPGMTLTTMVNVTTAEPCQPNDQNAAPFENLLLHWPYNKRTGKKCAFNTPLGGDVVTRKQILEHWPYNKRTGEKCALNTPLGGDIVKYSNLQNNWPYNKRTGEKCAPNMPLGGDIVTYKQLKNNWPCNKRTGEKCAFNTPLGGDIVTYSRLQYYCPYNKRTGEKCALNTPLGGDIVTYRQFKNDLSFDKGLPSANPVAIEIVRQCKNSCNKKKKVQKLLCDEHKNEIKKLEVSNHCPICGGFYIKGFLSNHLQHCKEIPIL